MGSLEQYCFTYEFVRDRFSIIGTVDVSIHRKSVGISTIDGPLISFHMAEFICTNNLIDEDFERIEALYTLSRE